MSNLSVNELDFDAIKSELITFLSNQSEFQDYDFTGSALNTLVDVCAYLIHYVGVQANFSLRESFLESAQLRKNISAIAKQVGYFPSQRKAGRGSFTITLDLTGESQPASLNIPKGTVFVSTLETGESISFVTYGDNPLFDTGIASGGAASEIWQGSVKVVQGKFVDQYWTVDSSDQRYLIDREGIDTDFLTVSVKASVGSSNIDVWTFANNLVDVGQGTKAYFLSEYNDGVEIYFGNDVIGRSLQNGNFISAEYLVTEGSVANGIRSLSLTEDIAGYSRSLFEITNVTPISDGAERESNESVRKIAPLSYQRQNRIVTLEDYKTAVLERYTNVKAINAWGGEDAQPVEYGKVFVSVAPIYGDRISSTTQKSIEEDVLRRFSVVGITPELVDPEYTYININTSVVYNKEKTTTKASELATEVQTAIQTWFDSAIYDYNQSFKYSRFLSAVDNSHPAIISSLADIEVGKQFEPTSNVTSTFSLLFHNELVPGSLKTEEWTNTTSASVHLADDSNGRLNFYINGSLTAANVGTVNYTTGEVNIPGFNARMQTLGPILMKATPKKDDVQIRYNNLGRLNENVVTVSDVREQ